MNLPHPSFATPGAAARPWSIVLAGGSGERLRAFTTERFGRPIAKQYCAFTGARSMFEHTLDRAARLSGPERVVSVVAREHLADAAPQLSHRGGLALVQPANRDTAAGILLPLAAIRARDPKAVVVIQPSDHFVFPETRFLDVLRDAVRAVATLPEKIVLVGVEPDAPEPDYGWISPAQEIASAGGRPVRAIYGFVEKPKEEAAAALAALGGLWNTFVMAARVDVLWDLCKRRVPDVVERFEAALPDFGGRREREAIERLYADVPKRNFSTDVLQPESAALAVVELRDVVWSDWGRPERILETLSRLGLEPSFPAAAPALAAAM